MLRVDVSDKGRQDLQRAVSALSESELKKAFRAAAKRAMTHGRTAGTSKLREVYTVKAGVAKGHMRIKAQGDGMDLRIEGGVEPVKHFRGTAERKKGMYVSIKKGGGGIIPRSFTQNCVPLMREGDERYPLRGIYGPSVPSMFANDEVIEATMGAIAEKYEERIMHELAWRTGGTT